LQGFGIDYTDARGSLLERVLKPGAGIGVTMREHHGARGAGEGKFEQFLTIRMGREVEFFNFCPAYSRVLQGGKEHIGFGFCRQDCTARGLWITVSDKADRGRRITQKAGGGEVAGGVFHHHPAGEQINAGLFGRSAGFHAIGHAGDIEFLKDPAVKAHFRSLFGNLVKVVGQIHP